MMAYFCGLLLRPFTNTTNKHLLHDGIHRVSIRHGFPQRIRITRKHNLKNEHGVQTNRPNPPFNNSMPYFLAETPTDLPKRPVVLVCCPRTFRFQ